MPTSSHHQLGVWTWWPLHTIHFSYSFTGGSCKGSPPSSSSWVVEGTCRKCSMPSSSFGEGPGWRSAEGCPASWSSSNVDSGSWKVTHQCCLVEIGLGGQVWLSSPCVALRCLLLHPLDLLLDQSLLCEWWWSSSLVLVVDQLSLSILSSKMEVAASAYQWASLALLSSCSQKCLASPSGKLYPNGATDEY